MHVTQLWRYPVKSLQGERLTAAEVDDGGIAGDRRWALFDAVTGMGLTARRLPELLLARGRWHADGSASIVLPDGHETVDDAVLSTWLGREVALRSAAAVDRPPAYENPTDPEAEATAPWEQWRGATGAFHDSARTRLSIGSEATIAGLVPGEEARRFRLNVVVDGVDAGGEDRLVGTTVTVGGAVRAEVVKQIDRCVMVTRPQPEGIERDLSVLRRINAERDGFLGVGAVIRAGGGIAVGDPVVPL